MIDYKEFRKELVAQIEEQIYERGLNLDLGFQNVIKNNGVSKDEIAFIGDSNIAPVVYINQLYQEYENGVDIQSIASDILENLDQDTKMQELDFQQCIDWEFVRKKVIFHVISSEYNKNYSKDYPCRCEADLLLAYRVMISVEGDHIESYTITNTIQTKMGVTEDELFHAAASNMPQLLPPLFETMRDTINKFILDNFPDKRMGFEETLDQIEKGEEMYLLSNTENQYGAATLFYPSVMEKIVQVFNQDMVVLPASIHEMILMPYIPELDLAEMKEMVMQVNKKQVLPDEVLSNQVYVYDKVEKRLMIGEAWNEQRIKVGVKSKQLLKNSLKEKQIQVKMLQSNEKKVSNMDMQH